MKNTKFCFISLILAILFVINSLFFSTTKTAIAQTTIDPAFNANNIITDLEIMDAQSLTVSDIQSFLQSRGSYLANYQTNNAYGETKTAAQIIYDASRNNFDCTGAILSDNPTAAERQLKCRPITTVNPKFLLTLLQKEQSLIQNPEPTQKALDEATGYGCPTGQSCNQYWKGFGKQVNSAALQFLAYMQDPARYNFKVNHTYIAKNKYSMLKSVTKAIQDGDYNTIVASPDFISVTIENQATAALYNYTPHVFNGNYNFYRLYNNYFPETTVSLDLIYPDGSILKIENEPSIWLIEKGKKRPFLNYASFISRFNPKQIITTTKRAVDSYPQGEIIKFSDYSIVQTPDKNIYLLVGNEKRQFDSLSTFKNIGFNLAEIETATMVELASYSLGKTITSTSTYVTGALLQDTKTGGIYYVENGTKAPLQDKIFLTTRFKGKEILKATPDILSKYTTIGPILFADGTLLKSDTFPVVYLISNGAKRAFASEEVFISLGYKMENILTVPARLLYNYTLGEIIQNTNK